jgi:hypothetical protein
MLDLKQSGHHKMSLLKSVLRSNSTKELLSLLVTQLLYTQLLFNTDEYLKTALLLEIWLLKYEDGTTNHTALVHAHGCIDTVVVVVVAVAIFACDLKEG